MPPPQVHPGNSDRTRKVSQNPHHAMNYHCMVRQTPVRIPWLIWGRTLIHWYVGGLWFTDMGEDSDSLICGRTLIHWYVGGLWFTDMGEDSDSLIWGRTLIHFDIHFGRCLIYVQLRPSRHTDNSTLYLPTGRNLHFLKILFNIHQLKFGITSQWRLEKPNHYNYLILLIYNGC